MTRTRGLVLETKFEPGLRCAGREVECLDEAEGLIQDGGGAVLVREADHGGGVVESQGCVPRRQVEPIEDALRGEGCGPTFGHHEPWTYVRGVWPTVHKVLIESAKRVR